MQYPLIMESEISLDQWFFPLHLTVLFDPLHELFM